MRYDNPKLGADPELFFRDGLGNYRSAIGLVGGTKEVPRPIDAEGSAVQEDNVAVEFNVIPSVTKEAFRANVLKVLNYLSDHARTLEFQLAIVPSAMFSDEELNNPMAQRFGCDPDWNVYTKTYNPAPKVGPELANLRSAGGHIHISWDNPKVTDQVDLVYAMDLFVGAPAIQYDGDVMRRQLYGKAGCFRFKPYGVEYRTPSNFWIKSPDMIDWAYTQTINAVDFLNGGGRIEEEHFGLIQQTINDNDENALNELRKIYPI